MELNMKVNYCCGGGHCGPVPGYFFECPCCKEKSGCRTGQALKSGDTFRCQKCKCTMKVNETLEASNFDIEIEKPSEES